jgi:hypothetical protein
MAEVRTGEFSSYRSNLIDMHSDMKVWLWDLGPAKPVAPKRPDPPSGKQGDPEYDLAVIEFKESLENYEAALKAYAQSKKDYAHWERSEGGPIERMFWSCDAADALRNDAKAVEEFRQPDLRYYMSARTRGWGERFVKHPKLQRNGLPHGMTPGRGQQANLERQLAGEKEFVGILKSDPVFGQEMQR